MPDKIIQNDKGEKFKVIDEEITGFESKEWYCWVGPDEPDAKWAWAVDMIFIFDRKPHRCNKAPYQNNVYASFFDSPLPNINWCWGPKDAMKYFRKCVLIEET